MDTDIDKLMPSTNRLVLRPSVVDQSIKPNETWNFEVPVASYLQILPSNGKITMSIQISSPDI
jgi:hypothetical protein